MLKMVIIEDERLEREGLVDYFDWSSFGIEIVGTASDGIEGIELAEKERPDIIITDIKMPGMSGIEMCKEIRKFLPNTKIIILSGHDDFNYAKEAILFKTNAYVLKPIVDEEMLNAIQRVVKECTFEQEKINEQIHTREKLKKEYGRAKQKLFNDLLEGVLDKKELRERMLYYGVKYSEKNKFVVVYISFKDNRLESPEQFQLEFLKNLEKYAIFSEYRTKKEMCTILKFESEYYDTQIDNVINYLIELCNKDTFNAITAIGSRVDNLYDIDKSYKCADEALTYAEFWGLSGVIRYKDVVEKNKVSNEDIGKFIIQGNKFSKLLVHDVSSGDCEKVDEDLEQMFDYIAANRKMSVDYIKNYLQNVIYEISLLKYNLNRKSEDAIEVPSDSDSVLQLKSLQLIKKYVHEVFNNVLAILEDKRKNKDENVIKNIVNLIENRYMEDINLKVVAAEMFFSPNYLGTIFKKFTGKSFNDYLTECRMDKAKELLTKTNKKVSRVAKEVGMSNTSYFCIVFKHTYGMTPKEYQEMSLR
ncbi:response regulator [Clostridium oryzae]|uniref:Stage 0 sporulation protein A homolog n=1 Tax=Clostridium oryzae TaxID=1450648 RepID=A0A1V4IEL6_9CLOT|nr:response regulator [Clostridium oryzae]OPJ58393.1 putative response regulatory protein [Clostridium oryzae]